MVDEDGDKARRLQRDYLRKIGANPDAMSDEEYRAATGRQFAGTPDDVAADLQRRVLDPGVDGVIIEPRSQRARARRRDDGRGRCWANCCDEPLISRTAVRADPGGEGVADVGSAFWYTAPVERLGIPKIMVSDGPHGLRAQPGEGDHVGLGGSLPATCFPTASAIASPGTPTWCAGSGRRWRRRPARATCRSSSGPGINMKRSPLCGRNFEYFSEDPFLAGELGVGIVDGIQSRGVGTSVKHYAANNQETDRLRVDAQVDERTLREIYLPAFERIVTACQPWTVMCSYNKVNGLSASENPWLLTTVLREEFGFQGLVVSDWGAVYHRVPAAARRGWTWRCRRTCRAARTRSSRPCGPGS